MVIMTPRRYFLAVLVLLAVIAGIMTQVPALSFVTIHGKTYGSTSFPYTAFGVAMAGVVFWSAFYVRAEPSIVRILLIAYGVLLSWWVLHDAFELLGFFFGSGNVVE